MGELLKKPDSESCGIFIGFSHSRPCVVAIGQLPTNYLTIAAGVHLAYSERAPRHLVADVGKALREWFQREGHDHVMVCNLLHSDRSYIRGLSHFGKGSRVGGVIRFDF